MWTADLEARLIQLWNTKSKTASQIADTFGPPFTRNSVIAKIWRMRRHGVKLTSNPTRENNGPQMKRVRRRAQAARRAPAGLAPMAFGALTLEPPPELKSDTLTPTIFSITDLEDTSCRWPYGEVGKDFGYCGRKSVIGLPYCGIHSIRAYRAPFLQSHPALAAIMRARELEPAE